MSFKADFVIKNANIHTMDPKNPKGSALAARDGRIIDVGEFEDFEMITGPGAEIIDAGGKTVLPGFNDNHSHPLFTASSLSKVNLTGTKSHEEFFARVLNSQ
jgi:predicted amidohydrolase YtcJ